jgi:DNA adenine methylase
MSVFTERAMNFFPANRKREMSYIGGKARGSSHILTVLNDKRFEGYDYLEPFVGMGHVLRRVVNKRSCSASDANPLVMRLLTAVQSGEALPSITRERYAQLKDMKGDTSLERAVSAFQYSFNGREFGGYVDTYTRRNGTVDDIPGSRANYYATLANSPSFARATLSHCDYRAHTPTNALVYCDPPYQGTTRYKGTPPFDHAAFWETMRAWSMDNVVLVSEYAAPPDFVCVASRPKPSCLAGGHKATPRVERLFVHESRRALLSDPTTTPTSPPQHASPPPPPLLGVPAPLSAAA